MQSSLMVKVFFKDLLRYLPSKIIPGFFGILIIPVFTRLFDPKEYGQYVIVISTISVLSIVAIDWITTSTIRFYAEYEKKSLLSLFNGTIIRITVVSIFFISSITCIILFFFRDHISSSLYYFFNIGLLIFAFGAAFTVMLEMFVVQRKPTQYSLFSVWRQCGCILIGIGLVVLNNSSVDGLLWGIVIGIIIMLPFLFRLTFKGPITSENSKVLKRDIMKYGFPLVATNLAAWVLALSDRYIIEHFRGSYEVGLYSISYSLADRSIFIIISLIILSSSPIAMKMWTTKGATETGLFIKDLTKYYLIVTLPAAVGLSLLSGPIIELLATESYYEGYRIMPLIAASIFIFGLQRNFQLGLLFHKKTQLIMYILLISGLFNLVLNIFFVPKYGFMAAGYTTLFSYIVFAILIVFASRRYFVFPFPFSTLLKVVISTVVMGLIVEYILHINLESVLLTIGLSIFFGTIIYFFVLILTKEIDKNVFMKFLSQLK